MRAQSGKLETVSGSGGLVTGLCALCGVQALRVMPFRYEFKERRLIGVRCPGCGLVFIDPRPSDDELRELYAEEYFTSCSDTCGAHGRTPYLTAVEDAGAEREAAAERLDALLTRALGGRGRLLELGCGPGYLLAEFRRLGWEIGGLEISSYAVAHAREHLGLEIVCGDIAPGHFPGGSADAVIMGDVLEHLPRPLDSLRTVARWLRPGGMLVVAVPSTLNLFSARLGLLVYRLTRRSKVLRIPPYHLFEYTPDTLRRMVTAAGFSVIRLRQSAVPLGRMGLRGRWAENAGKAALQVLALGTSRLFNFGGDRLLLMARRPRD
ncbi:MAG: class I SAM-dependent methyltransferase [Candidatus Eisenbacteria bacterium]|uniref:Class I SAM-dependent methyltransferase n=1 Tax=Eiseniibacteriota bacterium TaxID=2212470 RepID=A0A938BL80_UNCEI|nr:class I SAM-dependent methyltransferase [Candidatus Eisenbacteria bacterium]